MAYHSAASPSLKAEVTTESVAVRLSTLAHEARAAFFTDTKVSLKDRCRYFVGAFDKRAAAQMLKAFLLLENLYFSAFRLARTDAVTEVLASWANVAVAESPSVTVEVIAECGRHRMPSRSYKLAVRTESRRSADFESVGRLAILGRVGRSDSTATVSLALRPPPLHHLGDAFASGGAHVTAGMSGCNAAARRSARPPLPRTSSLQCSYGSIDTVTHCLKV